MKGDFQEVFETLDLGETQNLDLGATLVTAATERRTLRSSLPLLPLGSARDSQFRLAQILGRGGMGIVHLADQPSLGRQVAIKTVLPEGASRDSEDALLHEARVMGIVEHPNVVPVHVIGQDDEGRPIIVMKRIAGTGWDKLLDGTEELDDEDPFGFHLSVVMAVCRALEFAHHRKILHRDIKPENVMIGQFGEVYLLDWGLAVALDRSIPMIPLASGSVGVCGTPAYMAPEMTVGDGEALGVHTDVYLVGAVLYHAVTGHPPNRGTSLFDCLAFAYEGRKRDYPPEVPAELEAICEKAMAREPGDRFASVGEFRRALDAFLSHRNSHELVATATERLTVLQSLVEENEDDGVHQAFGEARFGFVSALQSWSQNQDAKDGLQACLKTMIEYELEQENVQAARALLSQLQSPDEPLRQRIDRVAEEIREREAKLEKLAYDYDENVGIGAKRWIIGVMAFTFAIAPFVLRAVPELAVPRSLQWLSTDPVVLVANAFGLAFLPLLFGFWAITRRRFKDHKASRIFVRGLLLMYVLGFGARTTTLWTDIPVHHAAAAETAVFASGLFMLGLSVDRRLFAAGLSFAFVLVPLLLLPDHTIDVYSVGAVGACLAFLFFDAVRRRKHSHRYPAA